MQGCYFWHSLGNMSRFQEKEKHVVIICKKLWFLKIGFGLQKLCCSSLNLQWASTIHSGPTVFFSLSVTKLSNICSLTFKDYSSCYFYLFFSSVIVWFQPMVNWWFGLVVWIPRVPLWKGLLLRGIPRISNYQPKPPIYYQLIIVLLY